MPKLVLLRHGESLWNQKNLFTGWTDVDLTERGMAEARRAGQTLAAERFDFDLAFTSVLSRAVKTLWLALEEMNLVWIPIVKSWRLNERHYGALQGLNKKETADKYGLEQVQLWRRSYATPPPLVDLADPRHPAQDRRYNRLLDPDLPPPQDLPRGESLQDTLLRVMPLWHDHIAPAVRSGRKIIISAHGNSLRALVKHLDHIPDADISELDIPTGIPLVYELDHTLAAQKHYYLGRPEDVARATHEVAHQLSKV